MRHNSTLTSLFSVLVLAATGSAQSVWQIAYPAQSPAPNRDWSSAFDEARSEAVMMFPSTGNTNQGWKWNGASWAPITAPLPPNRVGCYMVYDAARERVVLWGGQAAGGPLLQDLWEWDGTIWQQRLGAMPPVRGGAATAYDRVRNVTVMFGGYGQSGLLQDTWEWNGVAWSNPVPTVRPSARESASMAFDPSTQRTLLYGGSGTVDTWTWNGTVWQQHFPTSAPIVRVHTTMVADLARVRVVLHGGNPTDAQTWEWDGTEWHGSMPGSPGTILGAAGFYDTQRREVVVHGGDSYGIGNTNLTWIYRATTPATATPFGTGCAGSAGVPQLAIAPYGLPWIGGTARTVATNLPTSAPGVVFVTSFVPSFLPMSMAPIGAPGCDLLLQPDALAFSPVDGVAAEWTLSIPSNVALAGLSVYQQAFPIEPSVNPLGLIATNGLRLVLGIR